LAMFTAIRRAASRVSSLVEPTLFFFDCAVTATASRQAAW
jgi:hypothetical protein